MKPSGYSFLDEMAETNALISAMLSVMHPEQFELGFRTRRELALKGFDEVIGHWPSCFTALQVINNRTSPEHIDAGAPYPAFDIVASTGNYTGGRMNFPTLPLDFQLPPGSIIGLAGHMLKHSVEKYEGDRISFAWFIKDRVFAHVEAPQVTWVTQHAIQSLLDII